MATVKTSSPGFSAFFPSFGLVNPESATRFALEPLFTKRALREPTYFASFLSNSAVNLPAVSQPSRDESTSATRSSGSSTFPDTGTTDSPGLNSDFSRFFSANALAASSATFLNVSNSLFATNSPSLNIFNFHILSQLLPIRS
ncbi:unannotated protein [freshwater metagenome]|uniref:Unannotated protein n=1 Tax=freshwater metagenome TaxID=449393 RepID=A0A6J7T1Z7_9ZZZZ